MPDASELRPATRDELAQSLSFALRFDGRRRVHGADEIMANITAERLIEHLERSGYVSCTSRHWTRMAHRATWPTRSRKLGGSTGANKAARRVGARAGDHPAASVAPGRC